MRYVWTQYLFGGEPFAPSLMDSRTDPLLRALNLTPSPAVAVRSWTLPRPTFRPATATDPARYEVTVPDEVFGLTAEVRARIVDAAVASGLSLAQAQRDVALLNVLEFPNTTDAAEITTVTKVTKAFEGDIPPWPWPAPVFALAYLPASQRFRDGTSALINGLGRALAGPTRETAGGLLTDELETRYGFYAKGNVRRDAPALAEASTGGSGGGGMLWLALAAVAAVVIAQRGRSSGGTAGLGRTSPIVEAARLRKRAQALRHEGKHTQARELERRANVLRRR